jgi:hypothetical protein
VLQKENLSSTNSKQNELIHYSHTNETYTHLSPLEINRGAEELYSSTHQLLRKRSFHHVQPSSSTNLTTSLLDNNCRLNRRYQPYNKSATTSNNNTNKKNSTATATNQIIQQDSYMEDPLFGPIMSSSSYSTTTNSSDFNFTSSSTASVLEDSQVFEEFDDFINSPSRYLSSPPPSPALSPSSSDDDDLDFNDLPLFP